MINRVLFYKLREVDKTLIYDNFYICDYNYYGRGFIGTNLEFIFSKFSKTNLK